MSVPPLRGEWSCSRPGKCLRQPGQHRQVRVKLNAGQPANGERGERVVVLQAAELALTGGPTRVQGEEPPGFGGRAGADGSALIQREPGAHSLVGQRHLVERRLKSAPANVHSPCSHVSAVGSTSFAKRRRAVTGATPRSMQASWTGP